MGGPRHIREVIRWSPNLQRYMRAFADRLDCGEPFTHDEIEQARRTLLQRPTEQPRQHEIFGGGDGDN